MESITQLFEQHPMVLIASLPRNNADLARAAVRGGAHAVKIHLNVSHRASGTYFGSFEEEKDTIADIARIARQGGCLTGVMPGTDAACASPHELRELAAMGVGFMDIYEAHLPSPEYLEIPALEPMLALGHAFTDPVLHTLAEDERVALLEASIMHPDSYGRPLSEADLNVYKKICARFPRPVTVPTQKKIEPAQVRGLHAAGVRGIMIGAIVAGTEPERFAAVTHEFRDALRTL